jgi:hypothetical protein
MEATVKPSRVRFNIGVRSGRRPLVWLGRRRDAAASGFANSGMFAISAVQLASW